jgi:anti-anti-sigma factor
MRNTDSFRLLLTQNLTGPVVLLAGELDLAAAPRLRHCLLQYMGQYVTLDLSDVTFMDSTAIGILLAATKRTRDTGGAIVLHGVQASQMKVLRLSGVVDFLTFDPEVR